MKRNSLRADSAALAAVCTSSCHMECTDDMWNIFSSKESTFAFCALSNLLLSNTHLRQLQAGHALRQALQRIHLLSWLCKNANFSSGLIASIRSTSAKRSASFVSFGLTDKFIVNLMLFSFTYMAAFQHCIFVCTGFLTV